jgi:hypothetical protein
LIATLVHASYGAKDYARAIRWADRYAQEGGTQADIAPLRLQALYLNGDYAAAAAGMLAQVKANDAAGQPTGERELQVLASAQRKAQDEAGGLQTVERLATQYPKPIYWSDLLAHVNRKAMADWLFLDFFRLIKATGNLASGQDHQNMASLAMTAGFPGEAVNVLDEAKERGLVKEGDAAFKSLHDKAAKQAADDRAARTRDQAAARAARDGNGLAVQGQIVAAEGRLDEGITLMEQALVKGGLRRSDELRLRLGTAQALAGRPDAARKTLAALKGPEGLSDIAHLWWLYAGKAAAPAPAPIASASQPASAAR